MKRIFLSLLLGLAACQGEPPPDMNQTAAGPPPAELCAEIKKNLKGFEGDLSIDYNDKGEATVEQAAWMTMSPENHADLAQTLGFVAACASGRQSDAQPVSIRNESGRMLLETTVSTRVDLRSILKKGQ